MILLTKNAAVSATRTYQVACPLLNTVSLNVLAIYSEKHFVKEVKHWKYLIKCSISSVCIQCVFSVYLSPEVFSGLCYGSVVNTDGPVSSCT